MELIRSKSLHFDKYSQLKRPQTYGKKSDQLLIEKLRSDNVHIKHRLIELENELLKSKENNLLKKYYNAYYSSRAPELPTTRTVGRKNSGRIQSTKPENNGRLDYTDSRFRRPETTRNYPVFLNQKQQLRSSFQDQIQGRALKSAARPVTSGVKASSSFTLGRPGSRNGRPQSQNNSRSTTPNGRLARDSRPTTPTNRPITPTTQQRPSSRNSRPVTPNQFVSDSYRPNTRQRAIIEKQNSRPYTPVKSTPNDHYYGPSYRRPVFNFGIGRNVKPIPTASLYVPDTTSSYPKFDQPHYDFANRVVKSPKPYNAFGGEPHDDANFEDDDYYYYYYDENGCRMKPVGSDQQVTSRPSSRNSNYECVDRPRSRAGSVCGEEPIVSSRPASAQSRRDEDERPVSRCSSRKSVNGDYQELVTEERPPSRQAVRENDNENRPRSRSESRPRSSSGGGRKSRQELEEETWTDRKAELLGIKKRKPVARAKSASEMEKNHQDYVRWLHSSTWRVHSELMEQIDPSGAPDMSRPSDTTSTLFFKTGVKRPDTYIFDPNWM